MAEDPFPRERLTTMLKRLPSYLRLAWRLAKEPLLSRARRAAVVGAAGYLASPIDLVPGIIPGIGQLDDLAVALAAIRFALAGLSPDRRREHLLAVGLTDQDLTDDLRTVGATTAWLGRAGARTARRAVVAGGRAAAAGAGMASRGTRTAARTATPAARAVGRAALRAAGNAGARAVESGGMAVQAGGKAIGAARSVLGRLQPRRAPADADVLVTEADAPRRPPPPTDPAAG
jgi:uncharacterized membrane protein YkvA (DUF1232 family)